jgi:hypothetical protein
MAAEWLHQHDPGGPVMSLRERVRQLREECAWPQGELAERIGADPAQISRYENGKITRSATRSSASPRPSTSPAASCSSKAPPGGPSAHPETAPATGLAKLFGTDRELVLSFIDTLVTKTRLKALVGGIS